MKLSQLLDKNFTDALKVLATTEVDGKTALKISLVIDRALAHVKNYDQARVELLQRCSEKNEDGSPKLTEDGKDYVIEDTAGFQEAYIELMNTEVEMNRLDMDVLSRLKKITPAALIALKPLYE